MGISYKTVPLDNSKIDISQIYGTKADALNGTNAIYIAETNQSWKSDDLTAQINDDGSVLIMNHGIGIGWANYDTIGIKENNEESISSLSSPSSDSTFVDEPSVGETEVPQYDPNGFRLNNTSSDINPSNPMEEEAATDYVTTDSLENNESSSETIYDEQINIGNSEAPVSSDTELSADNSTEQPSNTDVSSGNGDIAYQSPTEIEQDNTPSSVEQEPSDINVENIDNAGDIAYDSPDIVDNQGDSTAPISDSVQEPVEEVSTQPVEETTEQTLGLTDNLSNQLSSIPGGADKVSEFEQKYNSLPNETAKEAYIDNANNMMNSVNTLSGLLASKGYSIEVSSYTGGEHVTGASHPTHGMGSKIDLKFYKNGERLNINVNSSKDDWRFITDCLYQSGLGVQYEKGANTWGDVYLQSAKNINGEVVNYSNGWGQDMTYTDSNGKNRTYI